MSDSLLYILAALQPHMILCFSNDLTCSNVCRKGFSRLTLREVLERCIIITLIGHAKKMYSGSSEHTSIYTDLDGGVWMLG